MATVQEAHDAVLDALVKAAGEGKAHAAKLFAEALVALSQDVVVSRVG
jgi:hypothetical protein